MDELSTCRLFVVEFDFDASVDGTLVMMRRFVKAKIHYTSFPVASL